MSKELAKKEETQLAAPIDIFDGSGTGFEEADGDTYSIPFISVLQSLSPQCNKQKGEYVKGAEPGMFYNTATGELYDGAEGIKLVPCYYQRKLTEWVPRKQGGGFRGAHNPEAYDLSKLPKAESGGKSLLENGNELADTRYHYCLLLTEDGPQQVVLSMTSTQIKTSKKWMTSMQANKITNPKTGKKQVAPMMLGVWTATTTYDSNAKGDFCGTQIYFDRMLDVLNQDEADIFVEGKNFYKVVSSGEVQADESKNEPSGASAEFTTEF